MPIGIIQNSLEKIKLMMTQVYQRMMNTDGIEKPAGPLSWLVESMLHVLPAEKGIIINVKTKYLKNQFVQATLCQAVPMNSLMLKFTLKAFMIVETSSC